MSGGRREGWQQKWQVARVVWWRRVDVNPAGRGGSGGDGGDLAGVVCVGGVCWVGESGIPAVYKIACS